MKRPNAFYAQSGGVTSVINVSACGVIENIRRKYSSRINKLYAGNNGILGALKEELIDTNCESDGDIAMLRYTPGCAFGSCRYRLKCLEENKAEYTRLINVFRAHNIGYFFYNGGGDSHDTTHKVSQMARIMYYPLVCIGIPKTIDNDLEYIDNCPGFGSVAKYMAVSVKEVGLDLASMAATSTKVFVLEVMGRYAGWIAAASALARNQKDPSSAPHVILFPEIMFDREKFLKEVDKNVKKYNNCVIVVSEGVKAEDGKFLSDVGIVDAFGHTQLGGVAPIIAKLVKSHLNYKCHWAVADYLQRSARHLSSKVDVEQAYALGAAAVDTAMEGKVTDVMMTVNRTCGNPYSWEIATVPLSKVANIIKIMPRHYIAGDGFHITKECYEYITPLIQGESFPPFENGVPKFVKLKKILETKKLPEM